MTRFAALFATGRSDARPTRGAAHAGTLLTRDGSRAIPGRSRTHLALIAFCILTAALGAQRGRGGGARGGEEGRPGPAGVAAVCDSPEYGLAFQAPLGLLLFTPEKPGRFGQILTNRRIIYLVSAQHREETIVVKYSDNMTDADLEGYRGSWNRTRRRQSSQASRRCRSRPSKSASGPTRPRSISCTTSGKTSCRRPCGR